MRRTRKTKLITMIALVVAVLGMSIGFATFSRILTISSRATVDPNRDTHKLVIYGLTDISEIDHMIGENGFQNFQPDFSKWSTTTTIQLMYDSQNNIFPTNKYPAVIDNSNFTITNLSADFSLKEENFAYFFIIRNEGENTIYFEDAIINPIGICTALDNTTQSLVEEVCSTTILLAGLVNPKTGEYLKPPYAIEVGDYLVVLALLGHLGTDKEIDGRYEVSFEDVKLIFSDVLPETEEETEE